MSRAASKRQTFRSHWAHIGDFHAAHIFPHSNEYGIPDMLPQSSERVLRFFPENAPKNMRLARFGFLPDNYILHNRLVHFFVDDWRFEKVWNDPETHSMRLSTASVVATPDFSIYYDYPYSFQVFNVYRSRWCGRYWQSLQSFENVLVVPSVSWGAPDTFDFSFAGIPQQQVVAVSSLGVSSQPVLRRRFDAGFAAMRRRLNPLRILWYGPDWDDARSKTNGVQITYYPLRIKRYSLKRGRAGEQESMRAG